MTSMDQAAEVEGPLARQMEKVLVSQKNGANAMHPLRGAAPSFTPLNQNAIKSVPNPSVNKKGRTRKKKVGMNNAQDNSTGALPKPPTRGYGSPILQLTKRPIPSQQYLQTASQPPEMMGSPRPLLVVLDLNGTLLFRKKQAASFEPRPHLDEFLTYLFDKHSVMVWSSAMNENVTKMCERLFTSEQREKLVAVWARNELRLEPEAYKSKSQVYKQLSWIWEDASVQAHAKGEMWSQANTVLLDDSAEKAASEPHNTIEIEAYEAREDQKHDDVLANVEMFLAKLSAQKNVSASMRSDPFTYQK